MYNYVVDRWDWNCCRIQMFHNHIHQIHRWGHLGIADCLDMLIHIPKLSNRQTNKQNPLGLSYAIFKPDMLFALPPTVSQFNRQSSFVSCDKFFIISMAVYFWIQKFTRVKLSPWSNFQTIGNLNVAVDILPSNYKLQTCIGLQGLSAALETYLIKITNNNNGKNSNSNKQQNQK